MAEVKKTVCQAGCDYTTIGAAWTWFVSNATLGSTDTYVLEIQDSREYSETLNINGLSGNGTASSNFKICSNQTEIANFPTIKSTSGHVITINEAYSQVGPGLVIYQNGTGSSDEGVRVASNGDYSLITGNVIKGDWNGTTGGAIDQDGIHAGAWALDAVYADHNVIYGFRRACITSQISNTNNDQTWYIDHCTLYNMAETGETTGGAITSFLYSTAQGVITFHVYNTLGFSGDLTVASECFEDVSDGTSTWNGDYNISGSDNSAESRWGATNNWGNVTETESSPSSGENVWFTNYNTWPLSEDDLQIAGENTYTVTQNGTDRSGSEPDSRQDFSVDIEGNSRGATPTIGAFEYSAVTNVSHAAAPIVGVGSMSGGHKISISKAAGALPGAGSVSGGHRISTNVGASPVEGAGSFSGGHKISVSVPAGALPGAGSISGTVNIIGPAGVSIPADPIVGVGSISGNSSIHVSQTASPVEGIGSISGASRMHVSQAALPIIGVGSISGTPRISVSQAAAALVGVGSLSAGYRIGVSVAASPMTGDGLISGTSVITGVGDVFVVADPVEGVGSASGVHRISVVQAADALEGAGSISGDQHVRVQVLSSPMIGFGSINADFVINVLHAANALLAEGLLSGLVNITAIGQLPDFQNPSLVTVNQRYLVTVTPNYILVPKSKSIN